MIGWRITVIKIFIVEWIGCEKKEGRKEPKFILKSECIKTGNNVSNSLNCLHNET